MCCMMLCKITNDYIHDMQLFTARVVCRYTSFENNIVFLKKIPPQGSTVQRYSHFPICVFSQMIHSNFKLYEILLVVGHTHRN